MTLLPPGFLLLFSYCPATAAGVSLPGGRGRRGWRRPLPRLCWSRSPAWARASGSRPGDSCAYKAAEAAEAGGGPGSGRYFGPGLPPPDPVSLGSLGGGTLGFYFWALPFLALCFLPLPWPEGWEERPLWVSLGGCPLVALDPGQTPGACSPSLSSDFWGQRVSLITSQDLTLGSKLRGEQKPWCQTPQSAIVLSP